MLMFLRLQIVRNTETKSRKHVMIVLVRKTQNAKNLLAPLCGVSVPTCHEWDPVGWILSSLRRVQAIEVRQTRSSWDLTCHGPASLEVRAVADVLCVWLFVANMPQSMQGLYIVGLSYITCLCETYLKKVTLHRTLVKFSEPCEKL